MKILLLSLLIAITVVVIPSVFAESFDEFEERDRLSYYTPEEYFEEFSSWASKFTIHEK